MSKNTINTDKGKRLTDNGDRTITDSKTGLMWTKNASHFEPMEFDEAKEACGNLEFAGYKDWRLPEINELESLIDRTMASPALPKGNPFVNVQPYYYWSATMYLPLRGCAWGVDVRFGDVYDGHKSNCYYVWPVRARAGN